jgi:hypothetical protein
MGPHHQPLRVLEDFLIGPSWMVSRNDVRQVIVIPNEQGVYGRKYGLFIGTEVSRNEPM